MCGTRRAGPGQHGHAVGGVLFLRPAASWVRARSRTAIWPAAALGRALPGTQDGGEALIGVAPGGGDGLRGIMSGGGLAASHVALNRGRRSIVVDLRHEGTALVLARLVQHATSSSSQTVWGSSTPSASVTTPCAKTTRPSCGARSPVLATSARHLGTGQTLAVDPLESKRPRAGGCGGRRRHGRGSVKSPDGWSRGRVADVVIMAMGIGDGSVLADALALVGKGAGWSSST